MHTQGNGSRRGFLPCVDRTTLVSGRGPLAFPGDDLGTLPVRSACSAGVSGTGGPGHTACALACSTVSGILAFVYRGQGTGVTLTSLGKLSHSSCLLGKGTLGERQLPPSGEYGDRRSLVSKRPGRAALQMQEQDRLAHSLLPSSVPQKKPPTCRSPPTTTTDVSLPELLWLVKLQRSHILTLVDPLLRQVLGCPAAHTHWIRATASVVVRWHHPTLP